MHRAIPVIPVIVLATVVAFAGPAFAVCKNVTVSATGAPQIDIDAATSSAVNALSAKVAATYGKAWSLGSRRNGSFHCDKALGGYKPTWTCIARTSAVCAP